MSNPKITKEVLETVYELAKNGISNKHIAEAINISTAYFYKRVDVVDTVKKAKSELRAEVSKSLLENANNGDTTSLIFLAKRLNLFSEDYYIDLKTPSTAIKSLEELANSNISLEHKNSLKGFISDYMKSYEVVELEERLKILENKIKG